MLRRLPPTVLRRAPMGECAPSWTGSAEPAGVERERLAVAGREAKERRQVRARPQAVHVRLAGADLAAEEHARNGGAIVDPDLGAIGREARRRRLRARRRAASTVRRPDADPRRRPPGTTRSARRATSGQGDATRAGPRRRDRSATVIRPTSPWRWNRAPRRHRRRACKWISAIVLWVDERMAEQHPRTARSVSRRRARSRLVWSWSVPRPRLVDGDPQPRGSSRT